MQKTQFTQKKKLNATANELMYLLHLAVSRYEYKRLSTRDLQDFSQNLVTFKDIFYPRDGSLRIAYRLEPGSLQSHTLVE